MKTSDRQIIALFQEIGVAECNGDVTILTGSCEMSLANFILRTRTNSSPERVNDWRDVRRSQVAMQSQLPHFLVRHIFLSEFSAVLQLKGDLE